MVITVCEYKRVIYLPFFFWQSGKEKCYPHFYASDAVISITFLGYTKKAESTTTGIKFCPLLKMDLGEFCKEEVVRCKLQGKRILRHN